MEPDELLHNVHELLGTVEGIKIIHVKGNREFFDIEFTVTDEFSRLLVFYLAEASNTILAVWSNCDPCSEVSRLNLDEGLIYALRSSESSQSIDQLCWLGSHLTWKLYQCGLLTPYEEREYCKLFGAVSRSA